MELSAISSRSLWLQFFQLCKNEDHIPRPRRPPPPLPPLPLPPGPTPSILPSSKTKDPRFSKKNLGSLVCDFFPETIKKKRKCKTIFRRAENSGSEEDDWKRKSVYS